MLVTDANGDTVSTLVFISELTSIYEQTLNDLFDLYPNPNKGSFTIDLDLPGADKWTLKVYNVLGREVRSENLGVISGKFLKLIDLGDALAGVYYVQLSNEKVTLRQKAIIY